MTTGFSGPKSSRDFRETGPRAQIEERRGEASGKRISSEYENGVVSRRFDRGADDGVPVETETNGNPGSIFTAMWPPFFKNVTYC